MFPKLNVKEVYPFFFFFYLTKKKKATFLKKKTCLIGNYIETIFVLKMFILIFSNFNLITLPKKKIVYTL